ncbi:hypothetical protein EVAR_91296_1 [Eumeta japonica]|uniref:Uncharacterized protein n=1 Tax=Eumeta variegata TaxID=151549 RepID=A0A4C1TBD0_EUMVA|nr:hypothetical protein EVAR_91296_1 [Eumeta japonica]
MLGVVWATHIPAIPPRTTVHSIHRSPTPEGNSQSQRPDIKEMKPIPEQENNTDGRKCKGKIKIYQELSKLPENKKLNKESMVPEH